MAFTLNIETNAFEPDPRSEVARILRELADRLTDTSATEVGLSEPTLGSVRDFNGNTVGDWYLT